MLLMGFYQLFRLGHIPVRKVLVITRGQLFDFTLRQRMPRMPPRLMCERVRRVAMLCRTEVRCAVSDSSLIVRSWVRLVVSMWIPSGHQIWQQKFPNGLQLQSSYSLQYTAMKIKHVGFSIAMFDYWIVADLPEFMERIYGFQNGISYDVQLNDLF